MAQVAKEKDIVILGYFRSWRYALIITLVMSVLAFDVSSVDASVPRSAQGSSDVDAATERGYLLLAQSSRGRRKSARSRRASSKKDKASKKRSSSNDDRAIISR